MSNKNNKKEKISGKRIFASILCIVLVALMVVSGAVLTIISSCQG